jgi:hypothetical protein
MDLVTTYQATIDRLADILKAGGVVRKDVTQSTGLNVYNLEPAAKILQPVYSPYRNMLPRPNTGMGTAANWKVVTGLDISRIDPFTAEGTKAATVNVTAVDKSAGYKTISKGDSVSFQSEWSGKGYIDQKAAAVTRLLATVIQLEEQALLFGRNANFGAITTPTTATATTGGTIAAATYNVVVRAISFPRLAGTTAAAGRGRASSAASQATTGATSTLSASTTVVEGAVAYEWYVGTAGNERLEAITECAHVKLTALAATGVTLASVSDNAADTLAFDGLITQLVGTAGYSKTLANGTAGTGTAVSLTDVDDMLQSLWDNYRVDPEVLFMNSREHRKLNALIQASTGLAVQVYTQQSDVVGLTGGVSFSYYVNQTTGKKVKLMVHPFWPKGTILASTFALPFSIPGLNHIAEVETRKDYLQLEYPETKPAYEFEVLTDEVLKVYFPGAYGVIRNIAVGA